MNRPVPDFRSLGVCDALIVKPPKPVGFWRLDPGPQSGTTIAMRTRPTDAQIKATEDTFGWRWIDAVEAKP